MSANGNGIAPANASDRLERWLGRTLGAGTRLATALLALGLLLLLTGVDLEISAWLSRLGLIVLMATPVARVAISVAEYASERDWPFLALTLTVLVMLLVSFLVGAG